MQFLFYYYIEKSWLKHDKVDEHIQCQQKVVVTGKYTWSITKSDINQFLLIEN